jgi:stalled ribosome rescue protein Dom34
MANFLQTVYNAILRLIPFEQLKTVVLASPGFTKDTVSIEQLRWSSHFSSTTTSSSKRQ